MEKENYSWQRFWCSSDDQLKLKLNQGGFLPDPENEYEHYYYNNPNVVTLDAISHIPCLILLGEAGMGKTTTMDAEYERIKAQIEESKDTCLWFNLGDYSDQTILKREIFNNTTLKNWQNGNHKLYLFLDSLDEGLLSLKTITRILKKELNNIPDDRLYLRITCRSADWKDTLTEAFEKKWSKDNVKTYNLCPLRRKDVEQALNKENTDTEAFFQELFAQDITLTSTPITLKFLLKTYKENQQFAKSKTDLYYEGCLALCEETNPDRLELDNNPKGKLSKKQRLIIAGRIAMITIFANKVAIGRNHDSTGKPKSDITIDKLCVGQETINQQEFDITRECIEIDKLCVGQETINQQEFDITRECIEEVLSISGLFSSKGTNRLGFAHKTYAEFLAAWYLNEHKISLPQIMNLIVAPEDTERKLIPQLHQTSAWLSSMRKDVLARIIETDPDVVLKGDISDDNDLRRKIVDNLLKLYEEEKLFDPYYLNSSQFQKLKHPQLSQQLRPYIQDKTKSLNVRQEAVNIARCCEVKELQNDLVELILDKSESIDLRFKSCACISVIGDTEYRAKLKPLIFKDLSEDTQDELKGYALEALWTKEHPDLTAKELFSALTPAKQNSFFGSYWTFISYNLMDNLETKDLIVALDWVKKQRVRYIDTPIVIEKLADKILLKAWENFDDLEIVKYFAEIALIQWNKYQDLITDHENKDQFKQELQENDDKRRKLIEQCVLGINEHHLSQLQYFYYILFRIPKLLENKDFTLLKFYFYNLIHKRFSYINDIGYKFGYFCGNNIDKISLEKDIFWLIEKIKEAKDETIQALYIDLIEYNFNRQNVEQIDALCSFLYDSADFGYILEIAKLLNSKYSRLLNFYFYTLIQQCPIFVNKFSKYFKAIDLDSEQAKKQKLDYYKYQELEKNRERYNKPLIPSPEERINICLEKIESGKVDFWCKLCMEMTLFPNSTHYDYSFQLNLMKLPGWKNADDSIKQRIIKCAKKYVLEKEDLNYDWIGTNEVNLLAIAGCKALYLLLNIEPDFVNKLDPLIWQKWASIIIAYPTDTETDRDEQYLKLVHFAYSHAKNKSIDTLIKVIDKKNKQNEYIFIIDKFKDCWDDKLKAVILEKITLSEYKYVFYLLEIATVLNNNYDRFLGIYLNTLIQQRHLLKSKCLEILCQELINHNCSEVIDYLKSFIKTFYPPTNQIEKDKILTATKLLINNILRKDQDSETWELIWQIIQQDTQFGREIVENLLYPSAGGFDLNLTETQLADFYIWLVQQYPYDEDPIHEGVYSVGVGEKDIDQVISLRNHLLNQLRETKTIQGCQEIERIIGVFPELDWLKQCLYDAQRNVRDNSWQPPTPEQIFQLIGDSRKRLVNDGNQLLEVLVESLERLEQELQGETPAIRDIWDKISSKPLKYKPISENEFSDYVKRFLDRDLKEKGIIANREVELRLSQGNGKGERTDIHIDAVTKNNREKYDCITVIIEVKGCWHNELNTAMETQLVNRYLKDNTCKHGIYLIGWFDCPQWDDKDGRKKDTPKITLEEAQEKFEKDAKDLSVSGINVKGFVLNTALR